jgi:hypothetical protein
VDGAVGAVGAGGVFLRGKKLGGDGGGRMYILKSILRVHIFVYNEVTTASLSFYWHR